jgi:hypothetical protein
LDILHLAAPCRFVAVNFTLDGKDMKRFNHHLLLTLFLVSASAYADDPASVVRTGGHAQIEKVSDFAVFSSSKKYDVAVPSRISAGDTLTLQYFADGKTVHEAFPVVWISIRGDLCWLHDRARVQGSGMGNTIYVQPCRKEQ